VPGQVLLDKPADGVLRLALANPARRGALDQPMLDALAAAVREAPGRGARALLVTGHDGHFSSGYDIGDLPDDVFAERAERLVAHPFTEALDLLEACDLPTVAALTGHAIGGGLELALCCDLRLAAPGTRLGMPPAKLGLVYSHTGLQRFVRAVGEPRTRELFLLGRTVDATTAARWGLVNDVAADVRAAGVEVAAELAANAPLSVRGTKQVLRALADAGGRLDPEQERRALALREASFASEDLREGVRAFAEKRPARWQGR
jgi:enoyl-CoA hydratase/carnithine racemase